MDADVYLATESGSARVGDDNFVFVKGETRVRAGHPLLKQCPDFFQPAADEPDLELPAKPEKKPAPRRAAERKQPAASEQDASLVAGGLTTKSLSGREPAE
jgi:hypothetical protein